MRLISFLAVIAITSTSCGEKLFTSNVDCEECYAEKPENVDLIVYVTLNDEFQEVPIVIYRGDVEDDQIVQVDTVLEDENPYYLYVPVGKRYSVKAKYEKDDATLYVVDGTKPKVLKVTDACDTECYVVEDVTLDARIKESFLDF
jgi:hypothetical protein